MQKHQRGSGRAQPNQRKRPQSKRPQSGKRKTTKARKPNRRKSTKNEISIENRRAVKNEERTTRVVMIMITILFISLAIGTLYTSLTAERPPTMAVEMKRIINPHLSSGVVIREEVVYTTDVPGDFTFHVEEHARIRPDTLVATVRNTPVVTQLEEENDELTLAVLSLQNTRSLISSQAENAEILNSYIREISNNNSQNITDGNSARDFANEINNQISIRNTLLLSETRGAVEPLSEQNRRNLNLISINQREIRARNGGLVSFRVDGLEMLDMESALELSKEIVSSILFEEENYDYNMETDAFRVVNSNTWQIASFMDNVEAADLSQGQNLSIFIEKEDEGFREIRAQITHLEVRNAETFVIFTMRDFMQEYIDVRTLNFTLDTGEKKGLRIPKTSMVNRTLLQVPLEFIESDEDDRLFFMTYLDEMGEAQRIQVLPRVVRNEEVDEGYMYILQDFETIRLGTQVVHPEDEGIVMTLEDIITDAGVFRANNGVASFISIDTTNMTDLGEEVVLDLDLNQGRGGLNIHDRIVTDTQNYIIYEGRSVF